MRRTLLLDLDGVLIHSRGYWHALRATPDHFARRMGQPDAGLTDSEIAEFEATAAGVRLGPEAVGIPAEPAKLKP